MNFCVHNEIICPDCDGLEDHRKEIESLKSRAESLEREKDAYRKKAIRLGQWFFAYQEKYKDLDTRSIDNWEVDATAMVDEEIQEALEGKEPKS